MRRYKDDLSAIDIFARGCFPEVQTDRYGREYDWVRPDQKNYTRDDAPYGYSEHFIWRNGSRKSLKKSDAVYHDRMRQWDSAKYAAALVKGRRAFEDYREEDCEKFLTAYFGRPIKATALSEGCNVSNGYAYFVFWYEEKAQ